MTPRARASAGSVEHGSAWSSTGSPRADAGRVKGAGVWTLRRRQGLFSFCTGEDRVLETGAFRRRLPRRRWSTSEHDASQRSTTATAVLALSALGVVFGDIGTSPLYALREAVAAGEGSATDEARVLGIVSLILWTLVLVVTVKYLTFVMRADNGGEGGILALLALLSGSGRRRMVIAALALLGTALLYGDGMITPAISVLSAVEGFEVATPVFARYVVPVSIVILVLLFMAQSRGTGLLGAVFGPVMVVWFAVLAVMGIVGIAGEPSVLRAFGPWYAVQFLFDDPRVSFLALGAVFLVATGSEALYADMGHFGRRPIALSWSAIVLPALMINYLGQGATILGDPATAENPFYLMVADALRAPIALLATLATVIASQALISGAFSLTAQAIQFDFVPRVLLVHTSERERGQIYVPVVNWSLMVACVGLVVAFGSSAALANAYGVAVTTTGVITTALLYRVMTERWRWPQWQAVPLTVALLLVDGAFFAANILKVPNGGWFPLLVAALLFVVMTTWQRGRELVGRRRRAEAAPLAQFLQSFAESGIERVPGTQVFLHRDPELVPPALIELLRTVGALAEQVILLTVTTDEATARVPPVRRATVNDRGQGFVSVELSYGFMEQPDVPRALRDLMSESVAIVPEQTTYVPGIERIIPVAGGLMPRWPAELYAMLHRNASPASLYFRIPTDQVLEVGQEVEL
jgi:KUP system potassium uptake protein